MLIPGLVSITFRRLTPEEILRRMQVCGLSAIEWGGDVHVPHGDTDRAHRVRELTEAARCTVASYGSYYRAGVEQTVSFDDVLATAEALGAPLIRVWAGNRGSDDASEEDRQRVADDARRIADAAGERRIEIAFEYHGGSLTDTADSAVRLLAAVHRPNVRCYWQPPVGQDESGQTHSLEAVLPWLANLHVFHWRADGERRPLREGRSRWERWFALADRAEGTQRFAMIEFVRGDSLDAFAEDARVLRELAAARNREE